MNPFSYGTIVSGDQFYDRKEECKRIEDTLSGGNNLVLYAPRRFGKTSLVFKAMEALEARGYVCIYFDFMTVFSLASFVRLYAKALAARQTNMTKFMELFASVVKSIRPMLGFGADGNPELTVQFAESDVNELTVAQLLDLPEKMAGTNKRVLIFFDEFQEVERLSEISFENLLRSKVQQHQRVNYLFFGSKTHMLKDIFNNKKRAFYNAAAQMSIGPLPEQDTKDYLCRHFIASGIEIEDQTAKYIIQSSSNIPHYIQLLAAEIWQYTINAEQRVVTHAVVDTCANQLLILKGDFYMELFDRQSSSKKQLLQALTGGGKKIFSSEYIHQHSLPASATLQRAVSGLIRDGLIEKVRDEYFIVDPFFKRYIQRILMSPRHY